LPARVTVALNVRTPSPLVSITLRVTVHRASMRRSAVLFPKKVDRLTVTLLAPPVSIAASPMALNVERVTVADDEETRLMPFSPSSKSVRSTVTVERMASIPTMVAKNRTSRTSTTGRPARSKFPAIARFHLSIDPLTILDLPVADVTTPTASRSAT
jgi:hypothetical protein